MTVSVDCGARSAENYFVDVLGYTGYDTGTPTGATATDSAMATDGADSITLSGAPASDSEVVATIFFDLGGAGTASVVAGTGWTEIYDSMGSDNYTLGQTQARTGSTSTAVDWNDVFDGTGTPAKAIALALEIKASGGAASIVPQAMAQYINQVIQ
jgi:hypothetical protein